jgi:hypothetical protein
MAKTLIGVAVILLILICTVNTPSRYSVIRLQSILNNALQDNPPIVFTEGIDFKSPPGTIVFLSRKSGIEKMIKLARAGEPELSIIFLPRWKAWITVTTIRNFDETKIDSKYVFAALASKMETELWHTHNDIGQELAHYEGCRKRSLQWIMPSPQDLLQLYGFVKDSPPGARLRGVIASIYGVLTYWNDDPLWAQATYINYALIMEGHKLNREAGKLLIGEFQSFAQAYKGFIRLRFEPAPKSIGRIPLNYQKDQTGKNMGK